MYEPLLKTIIVLLALFWTAGTCVAKDASNSKSLESPAFGRSATSIPSLTDSSPGKDLIINGKVEIKKVEIRGDVLFPEYGITESHINSRLNRAARRMSSWMTVSDMHRIADDLTMAYHEKGLTFNQAYVIPQEIRNNTLVINVLAGRLSEIKVARSNLYSDEMVKAPFMKLLGQVVFEPAIASAMREVNRLPGIKVFGFFSVGRRQGETRLNLHVQRETPQTSTLRVDNWGIQNTGSMRAIYQWQGNNVSGKGDTVQATLMSTDEVGNLFGGIFYRFPWNEANTIGAGINTNQFEIAGDLADFGLRGHLESISSFWNVNLLFEDNARADINSNLALKQSVISSEQFSDVFAETITYMTVSSIFQVAVYDQITLLRQGLSITPQLGTITSTNNDNLDSLFFVIKFDYDLLYQWPDSFLGHSSTRFNTNILYTTQAIPSAERSIMTGAFAVRAYEPALFSADTIIKLTLEQYLLEFTVMGSQRFQPFVFIDYATGQQNDDYGNDASFLGGGFGMDWSYKDALSARITAGIPLAESSSIEFAESNFKPVAYGYINWNF